MNSIIDLGERLKQMKSVENEFEKEDLIAGLEETIEMVEQGQLQGILIINIQKDNDVNYILKHTTQLTNLALFGALKLVEISLTVEAQNEMEEDNG